MRLSLRLRVTLVFATCMAAVLAAVCAFVYVRTGADLLDTVDAGLRSRAEVLAADARSGAAVNVEVRATLIEPDEAFAQIADASGRILESSDIVADHPLLPPATVASIARAQLFDHPVPGIDNVTRILAVPVETPTGREVVIVGVSLADRRDAMLRLAATLSIGGFVALLLISYAGWLLVGAALRPVERIRSEASAISAFEPGRRLPVPSAPELARLATTLNGMLARLQEALERERRFVDDASHELRTPLGVLKAELDLAIARPRSTPELEEAIHRASEETDRLATLAEDLLTLSRAEAGRLPVHREDVRIAHVIGESCTAHERTASEAGVRLRVDAPDTTVRVDAVRLRQAIDNLLDNSLGSVPYGGSISVSAVVDDGELSVVVEDSGTGFPEEFLPRAFEPFARAGPGDNGGSGLGLAIVRAIAEGHGGRVLAANRPQGGAKVTLVLRT